MVDRQHRGRLEVSCEVRTRTRWMGGRSCTSLDSMSAPFRSRILAALASPLSQGALGFVFTFRTPRVANDSIWPKPTTLPLNLHVYGHLFPPVERTLLERHVRATESARQGKTPDNHGCFAATGVIVDEHFVLQALACALPAPVCVDVSNPWFTINLAFRTQFKGRVLLTARPISS